jgi:hypothetical protein
MEPSSPIGRAQSGSAALFVMPSPKKTDGKADRAVDDEPYINERKPSSTTAAKDDSINGPSLKKTDWNGNQVVDYKPFVDERKPSSMTTLKVNLHNGEHTLIPVTAKNDSFRCTRMQTVRLERRPTASHGEACGCG